MRRSLAGAILVLVLSLAMGPAAALARSPLPWELPRPTKFAAALTVKTGGGDTVGVIGWGHNVLLAIQTHGSDEPGAGSLRTEYLARGRVTAHGIFARFGDLGVVSVRFRPKGRIASGRLPGIVWQGRISRLPREVRR
jgi:hypothetical protein